MVGEIRIEKEMAKKKNVTKKQKQQQAGGTARPKAAAAKRAQPRGTMGPVASISTAPVAIGNSLRGSKPVVVQSGQDIVRVVGRDFAFTAYNSGTISNWCLVGGLPLTPACLASSVLRNFAQMYNKFKINAMAFHYITSSATSSTGDVLFQVNSNRSDPLPNWTSSQFLPYAMSKPQTVIGPQWTNHTCALRPKGGLKTLTAGSNLDIDYQASGEVFLYSKTSSIDSPGYVIVDYDITFQEMSINPRSGVLPNPSMLYNPAQLVMTSAGVTSNATVFSAIAGSRGPGNQPITPFTSNSWFRDGDIFKIAVDWSNTNSGSWTISAGTMPNNSVLIRERDQSQNQNVTLTDGYTLYMAVYNSVCYLYASVSEAFVNSNALYVAQTFTPYPYNESSGVPIAGIWLYVNISWVGNTSPSNIQQQ